MLDTHSKFKRKKFSETKLKLELNKKIKVSLELQKKWQKTKKKLLKIFGGTFVLNLRQFGLCNVFTIQKKNPKSYLFEIIIIFEMQYLEIYMIGF